MREETTPVAMLAFSMVYLTALAVAAAVTRRWTSRGIPSAGGWGPQGQAAQAQAAWP